MMRYIWLVATREFAENARTKGFWIGIISFPLIIMASFFVMNYLAEKATPTRHYVLVDQSGEYEEVIDLQMKRFETSVRVGAYNEYVRKHANFPKGEGSLSIDLEKMPGDLSALENMQRDLFSPEQLDLFATDEGWTFMTSQFGAMLKEGAPEFEEPKVRFQRVDLPEGVNAEMSPEDFQEAITPYLMDDKKIFVDGEEEGLFAAVLIPEDIGQQIIDSQLEEAQDALVNTDDDRRGVEYWSVNLTDTDLRGEIKDAINGEIRANEYKNRGVDKEVVAEIENIRAPFTELDPSKEEGEEEVSMADTIRQWAPVGFVYLLWISILQISMMLLNNTIEEKSNRIIEVLLSSVTPWELMMGKLLGIAMVGLTMMAAWMASLVGLLAWKAGPEAEWAMHLFEVISSGGFLAWFGVYFVLGYLMYAGMFLAIGAVCNTLKEAQNFMQPVMIIMMVPLFTMMFIPKDPNGPLATVLSWIPLYTPFVMMNRAAASPPAFDLYGTLVVLAASTLIMLWLSGKVFRVGILRTGQPPKFRELFRWLKGGN